MIHAPKELRATFKHFDTDGNGHIDRVEFRALMAALDADMEPEEADIGFEIIDEDGNGTIEFTEFARWWNDRL